MTKKDEYDSFEGKTNVSSLNHFFEDCDKNNFKEEWQQHFKQMPEFENEENLPFKKLTISFECKEDYENFAKLIDQNLTERTKYIWFPKKEKKNNSILRWMECEDDND